MAKHLRDRVKSLEEGQIQLLDKINSMQKESQSTAHAITATSVEKNKTSKYACDLCHAKFSHSVMLQKHRKQAHKASYNI